LLYSFLDHYFDRDSPESVPPERRQWVTSGSGAWSFPDNRTVWAQTSTAADARAVAGYAMRDTALLTRLRAVSFDGSDRWFGVLTRYQNASNYYYVTLRSSNRIDLKRLVNGTATVLDSATLAVSPGTTFDIRVEDVGDAHRVYVNGVLTLEANDSTFATGKVGFATYKTSAEFEFIEVRQF
jgi:pectate lyase